MNLRAMLTLLLDLEWSVHEPPETTWPDTYFEVCPTCHGTNPGYAEVLPMLRLGHADDCALMQAIREIRVELGEEE